ncbi:hypothetical protein HMPREF1123_03872 [Clostridioides difficile 050-P50-2011]|nr:hypothetical protein HMPREF1123_03872 [Clostridioides difficile 050-P50-2011]EHJ26379.1 hypothetical protein HMPREF1122_03141 [Clostridioides difficile 002-P50-2011]
MWYVNNNLSMKLNTVTWFYINYVVCKFDRLHQLHQILIRFILTMWYVNFQQWWWSRSRSSVLY